MVTSLAATCNSKLRWSNSYVVLEEGTEYTENYDHSLSVHSCDGVTNTACVNVGSRHECQCIDNYYLGRNGTCIGMCFPDVA
jgi:hypothetical protein